ncbi:DUF3750 domain-containing protein [Rhodopila sp.]|uniref:DUF3750 domain-containing protein n=1 Tax=Rhodopila sp. TaxID=2480087 RepID=UPI003D11FC93
MMSLFKTGLTLFAVVYLLPLGIAALRYLAGGTGRGWRSADRSSIGALPPPEPHAAAVVRIFSAQTVRWRGIMASHCWIVFKPYGASSYRRYDYTAWGELPIRVNGFEPDGRWFGKVPQVVFAADGDTATALLAKIEAAIAGYAWRNAGDYRAWPGPNSNTFVAAILDAVPEMRVSLPPTAIGKDYPYDGQWLRRTRSGPGLRLTLGGYAGVTLAWVDGIEVNILGAVAGLDIRRPAVKLPGLGRFGVDQDGSS